MLLPLVLSLTVPALAELPMVHVVARLAPVKLLEVDVVSLNVLMLLKVPPMTAVTEVEPL